MHFDIIRLIKNDEMPWPLFSGWSTEDTNLKSNFKNYYFSQESSIDSGTMRYN